MSLELLPDCRTRELRGTTWVYWGPEWGMVECVRVFCANCGKLSILVPKESCTFAFALCPKCEKLGKIAQMMATPDEVFFRKALEVQQEIYGRELTALEQAEALKDSDHILSKLVRDRKRSAPKE